MMIKKVSIGIMVGILLILMLSDTAFATDVTLTLSVKSGQPGDSIEISGTYDPNEWVTVKILDSDGNLVFLKPVRVQDDGTYKTTFIVPDLDVGTLRITAGSGSDVGNADFTVKKKPTPVPTLTPTPTTKPTAVPSSSPTPSSTTKPTAVPSSSPTPSSTTKPTAVSSSSPTPSSTVKPTVTPSSSRTLSSIPTPTAVPTPAPSSGPTATNGDQEDVPDTGDDAQAIAPIRVDENEEAGTITIEIDISDLPEGTVAIRLPNGEIVTLDGSDTLLIEISKSEIGDNGLIRLTPLDDEGAPLGVYEVQLEQFQTLDTSNAWNGIWSVLTWVLIGIGVLGAAGVAVYLIMRKRNHA